MFGLSWGQIGIIVLIGLFVLGPERIPTAVSWVMSMVRKLRTMAAGAQAELRREIGPELDELRRQVADLQSLKELQELRDLRELHPKRLIGKNILGDEFSGGMKGFLGMDGTGPDAATRTAAAPASGVAGRFADTGAPPGGPATPDGPATPGGPATHSGPATPSGPAAPGGPAAATGAAGTTSTAGTTGAASNGSTAVAPRPAAARAAPRVGAGDVTGVVGTPGRTGSFTVAAARAPFDADGT